MMTYTYTGEHFLWRPNKESGDIYAWRFVNEELGHDFLQLGRTLAEATVFANSYLVNK